MGEGGLSSMSVGASATDCTSSSGVIVRLALSFWKRAERSAASEAEVLKLMLDFFRALSRSRRDWSWFVGLLSIVDPLCRVETCGKVIEESTVYRNWFK